MTALFTNIGLAFLWLMLSRQPTIFSFIIGYLIGFGLIALFSKVLGGRQYVRRSIGFVSFLFQFLWQFIKANLEVAWLILAVPKSRYLSGFVEYSIEDMSFAEALLLSHCITLTPGTITAAFDWDLKRLNIHVLYLTDPSSIKEDIDQKLKRNIWKFSR